MDHTMLHESHLLLFEEALLSEAGHHGSAVSIVLVSQLCRVPLALGGKAWAAHQMAM